MAIRLCKVFRICRISDVQRKEDACFFFSQVQSFKYGSANLFRSECVDAESKGDDGFKTVNLHAAFVRQFDGMLCLIFPQNTAFTKSLYPCSDCWGDNPEQLSEFPLGHGNGDCIGRQGDVALSVHRDDASFLFHLYSSLWVIKWHCKCFSPYPPTCRTTVPSPDLSFGRLSSRRFEWSLCWYAPTGG